MRHQERGTSTFGRAIVGLTAMASVVAVLMVSERAHAQARTADTVLMATDPRARTVQQQIGFADAVIAGDLVFLSGIVAGQAPGETSLVPAYERVFAQIGRILARAGASYGDIVDMTSYHTDITAQIGPMSEVSRRVLGSPPPAWTAIDVDRLLPDGGVTEIKIIARRPSAATRTNGSERTGGN